MGTVGMGFVGLLVIGGMLVAIARRTGKMNAKAREQDTRQRSMEEGDFLAPPETVIFLMHKCPDCGAEIVEGPHGGMSVNYICIGLGCGSRFNSMGPIGIERISEPSPRKVQVDKVGHA